MSDIAIRIDGLSKQYEIGAAKRGHDTLRDTLVDYGTRVARWLGRSGSEPRNGDSNYFWALKDVSFEVKRGQVMGIIGRNGAGKSTLLKILSRITEPTSGRAEIHGRVGSLLEVGTGFDRELTGRENVYLNGTILGMRKAEIDRKFDEIVDFSGVEKFLDTPVKRYSSGMYVRLAFAVAAHLEPEVLIVDEVLAVGDAEFQRKCLGKMGNIAEQGRTILFVSHSMSAVLRLCSHAILLNGGQLEYQAPSAAVVDRYLSSGSQTRSERVWSEQAAPTVHDPFRPIAVRVCDATGRQTGVVRSVQPFSIEIEYELMDPIRDLALYVKLYTNQSELLFISSDRDDPSNYERHLVRQPGKYLSRCRVPADLLNRGGFVVGISASVPNWQQFFGEPSVVSFSVDDAGSPGSQWAGDRGGLLRPAMRWDIVVRDLIPDLTQPHQCDTGREDKLSRSR
jgi:homopolymeric O-antigen transport system ATP-binding protein